MLTRLSICIGIAAQGALAAVPWPKEKPLPPVDYASRDALAGVALDGLPRATEVALKWKQHHKLGNAVNILSAAPDLPEIKRAWDRNEVGKAGGMLVWTLLKIGFPPADVVDLAGKTMAAGMLAGKDAAHRSQLDAIYRSYMAAGRGGTGGDRGVYGFRQGFLSGNLREEIRRTCPGVTEDQLRRMEESALRTYCENRAYQERFEDYKKGVRTWMGQNGIPWSGDEASFERMLAKLDEMEKSIAAKGASNGLFDAQRARLIKAILHGGVAGQDAALADYFSRYFGDSRNARGEKLGPAAGAGTGSASAAGNRPAGTFRYTFEWAIPPDRRPFVGAWQKDKNPIYQTGELYVDGKSIGAYNITNGGEATMVRTFVVEAAPGTPVKLTVTVPKAGPGYTMTITQVTGPRDATYSVWWFTDSINCVPKN